MWLSSSMKVNDYAQINVLRMIKSWQGDQKIDRENLIYTLGDHSRNIYSLDIILTKDTTEGYAFIIVLNDSTERWWQFLNIKVVC